MLDRFTDRARKVMSLAKEEAKSLKTTKVGTEHLLLALAKEQEALPPRPCATSRSRTMTSWSSLRKSAVRRRMSRRPRMPSSRSRRL